MLHDTIAAISTPPGAGGLAVVRLSGPAACAIAGRVFEPRGRSSARPEVAVTHTVHYGHVVRRGRVVDEVLLTVLRAPRTYTREDVVEISCHGGVLPARSVLDALLESGARTAEAGEFTKRAFLNGRIDLAQAEAVADLIHSQTELALAAAHEQLAGALSRRVNGVRDDLMRVLAHVEAHLDFPDEDIAPDTREVLAERLAAAVATMDDLLQTADDGRILRRGLRAAIVGRPNAGKSSLLNQLVGRDRAIVSHVPGTTRDTIEETASVRGIPVIFIDTAGLRDSGDAIEQEGIRRSRETLRQAELILHVLDASEPLTAEDSKHLDELAGRKRILVRNKVDLPGRLVLPLEVADVPAADVSCATGQGVERLREMIEGLVWTGRVGAGSFEVAINSRHQDALRRARAAAATALEALRASVPLDLMAVDLHGAVRAVGEIVGRTTTEDLLDSIFSQFCIGK